MKCRYSPFGDGLHTQHRNAQCCQQIEQCSDFIRSRIIWKFFFRMYVDIDLLYIDGPSVQCLSLFVVSTLKIRLFGIDLNIAQLHHQMIHRSMFRPSNRHPNKSVII